jgi:hypothetical protein
MHADTADKLFPPRREDSENVPLSFPAHDHGVLNLLHLRHRMLSRRAGHVFLKFLAAFLDGGEHPRSIALSQES